MEVSVRLNWSMSCIKLASVRKNSRVIVIVDALLEGKRVLNMQNRLLRGDLFPPLGPRVKDAKRKFPTLVRHTGYYSLLAFHIGSNEVVTRSPREIKSRFRALGHLVKGSGPQVTFSVSGYDEGRNRMIQQINT